MHNFILNYLNRIHIGILLVILIFSKCNFVFANVNIDSVIVTPSKCDDFGSISVFASGDNTPFIYSIISGTVTRPVQSGSVFNAIPDGVYTILVQNQIGERKTLDVYMSGNYNPISIYTNTTTGCSGSTGAGSIVVNASLGRKPYTYEIINGPQIFPPQYNDTFTNLVDGNYTIRVTDSCGNMYSTDVNLYTEEPRLYELDATINMYFKCADSAFATILIGYNILSFPIKVITYNDFGDTTISVYNENDVTVLGNNTFLIENLYIKNVEFGGQNWYAKIINSCGNFINISGITPSEITSYSRLFPSDSCIKRYDYSFHAWNINRDIIGHFNNVDSNGVRIDKYYLFDSTLNQIVDSATLLNINIEDFPSIKNGIVGHVYQLIFITPCDTFKSLFWIWEEPYTLQFSVSHTSIECLDSTTSVRLSVDGIFNYFSKTTWTILSGPSTIHSTKPKFDYNYDVSYPISYITRGKQFIDITNLGIGTYYFKVVDSCGNTLYDSITITNTDVNGKSYSFSKIDKNCNNNSGISYSYERGLFPQTVLMNINNSNLYYLYKKYTIYRLDDNVILDSITIADDNFNANLDVFMQGKYVLKIETLINNDNLVVANFDIMSIINNVTCPVIYDTITVNGSAPNQLKILGTINSFCKDKIATQVIIDETAGGAPYWYEITAGPQTFPPQLSNIFLLPSQGIYNFKVTDSCGRDTNYRTAIDTLIFPPIKPFATPCLGTEVILSYLQSPFYTYQWQLPNGIIYIGDSLIIPSVSYADTGIYIITRYANIDACKDTVTTTFHLETLARITQNFIGCEGDTVKVGVHNYTTTNIYIDTLKAARGCDSIVTSNIIINKVSRLVIDRSYCQGTEIIIANKVYNLNDTGLLVIKDTLQNSTSCDSIITYNITINPTFERTIAQYACSGDTIKLKRHLEFNQDPIIIIDDSLFITSSGRYLVNQNILGSCFDRTYYVVQINTPSYFTIYDTTRCQGNELYIGNHVYNKSGIYLDTTQNSQGCDSVNILFLKFIPVDTISISKTICEGQQLSIGDSSYYTTGNHITNLKSIENCDSIISLDLSVLSKPVINAIVDKPIVDVGESVQLNITTTESLLYSWQPSTIVSNANIQNPTALINEATWFTVIATNNITTCTSIDSVLVNIKTKVEQDSCTTDLFIPNAFSPNNDGINDVFRVRTNAELKNVKLLIFDRWGNKVFESNNVSESWDGNYRGKRVQVDAYGYYFYAECSNGYKIIRKGNITILE